MWRLKGYPRCEGDMFVDRSPFGWYEYCLQCGYQHELNVSGDEKGQEVNKHRNNRAKSRVIMEVTE